MAIAVETFSLDGAGEGTLQGRIQHLISARILSGEFRRGEKLPSSRKLAAHLDVSRITVTLAYTELVANDYLVSRGRSGYFVSDTAPEPLNALPEDIPPDAVDWSRAIGQRFSGGLFVAKPQDWARYKYPFIYGQADPTLFDHSNWRQCALRALGTRDFNALTSDYFDQDDPELVEYIVRNILPRRGIRARPEQVLVTLGAQNALWLTAQVLLNQRRTAVIENPCYPPLRDILVQSRCHVAQVDVDNEGLVPEDIPDTSNVIFTTPTHQCPTTATMSLERRRAVIKRAQECDALIVEDDYGFEMTFLDQPKPALKSLDQDGRVIYVGSFSKSLFPGLRLGYLVGSVPFIEEARALRASVLRHPPGHLQRTAAYFLRQGHYDALINRLGKTFYERRRILEAALAEHGIPVTGRGLSGGSALWMRAPKGVEVSDLIARLKDRSTLIEDGCPFFTPQTVPEGYYRLAYSSIPADRIAMGVKVLAEELEKLALSRS